MTPSPRDGVPLVEADAGEKRKLSPGMQAHVDSLEFGDGVSTPTTARGSPPLKGAKGEASGGSGGGGSGGGGGGSGSASARQSNNKFSMNSAQIAHALVSKFDQFTRRREDHMRTLLWTFGSDPAFESEVTPNAIRMTPQNFKQICHRFSLPCTEEQAKEIFVRHQMPLEGCNMYTLAKRFNDSSNDGLARRQGSRFGAKSKQEESPLGDPFKLARISDAAWRQHSTAGSPPTSLPPIVGSSAVGVAME